MKLKLNKLKNDSQEIINNLQATVDSLIKIAFEYQTENEALKAENERLEAHITHTNNVVKQVVEDTKSEAIKEFAERLEAKAERKNTHLYGGSLTVKDVKDAKKEMVGDAE